jgi:hypothetical protein
VIGAQVECMRFRVHDHFDACRLVKFLASEGAWFEFVPHDDDTYIVAVQLSMVGAVIHRFNQWHVFVERLD